MDILRLSSSLLLAIGPTLVCAAQLLVLNKEESTLAFVDPASGKIEATIPTGEGPHEIELSSDHKLAFVSNYGAQSDGNTLSIVDVSARKELQRVDLGELARPHGLSFANGALYFTAERARKIGRLNPASRAVEWTFATDQDGTHMVLAARDGATLYASNIGSSSISVIERGARDQWTQMLISVGTGPEALDLSPDGRELWTAHSRDGGVSIIDTATKRVIATLPLATKRSNRLKFTPNGQLVLISDLGAGELVVVEARTRTQKVRLPIGRFATGILIPSDDRAYVALSGDNEIAVVDLATLRVTKKIATGKSPDGMAWVR